MTETKTDFFKKNFSHPDEKILPVQVELSPVLKNYLLETRWVAQTLKNQPKIVREILRVLSITKDNSLILGFTPVYKILKSVEHLYKGLNDKQVIFTENLEILLEAVAEKLFQICTLIENGEQEELLEIGINTYLLYLDKALAGEIFNAEKIFPRKNKTLFLESQLESQAEQKVAEEKTEPEKKEDSMLQIQSSKVGSLVNQQEEMIARSYIIMNQVELLKTAVRERDMRTARDSFKQITIDAKNLQNSLMISHDQLLSYIHDDVFLQNHKDFHGFFILCNGRKYLIPSEFVVDVVTGSALDYEEKMNQKYLIYIQENEAGTEKTREEIPVYSLSSLLPGNPVKEHAVLDSIIIVNFQSQKIGIIVDKMQKFVSLIKKPMPPAFVNFPILKGLAFDEKYDMIPILYVPEIMKKFRAMRPYEQKIFEANTKKHIERVLIVEDSETTRLIERTILENNGYLVEDACDGIEAMAKIKETQFDLILCDDDMPRMNGEIFLDNVRRMGNYETIPVIAVSNTNIPKSDAFISKSDFKRDTLIQTIKEFFNGEQK
jgi:CheY-like chemotaxis protein